MTGDNAPERPSLAPAESNQPTDSSPNPLSPETPRAAAGQSDDTLSFHPDPYRTREPTPGELAHTAGSLPPSTYRLEGYEIIGLVGKGGMGIVYKARDVVLGRMAAIKTSRTTDLDGDHEKSRFLHEARSAARLRHPNICPIYDVRESEGRLHICMALIEGLTLSEWATRTKPPPRQLAKLVAVLSRAVHFAHQQGVLHRDLKPSNVMVESASGQPMLMDFGLARDLDQERGLTMTGDVLGTPAYMAPEQAAGRVHEHAPAVDIYSLGVIIYELLAGRPPFRGAVGEVLLQVQTREPEPLRRLAPSVHPDLATICEKAMAKEPSDRYASAAALADDLERFSEGEAILARPASVFRRTERYVRKHSLPLGLGVTTLVTLLALLLLTPALSRSWRLNMFTARLEAELVKPDWAPDQLPQLDALAGEIAAIAPEQATEHRRRIASRLDAYVGEYLDPNRGRWSPDDWRQIDAAVAELSTRDGTAGSRRAAEAARLRGMPERIADLRPPWRERESIIPGLRVDERGQLLRSSLLPEEDQSQAIVLSNQASSGEFQIAAEFDLPPGQSAGLLLNAKEFHRSVTALAVHPSGKTFASASKHGGPIRVWDAESGEEIFQLAGHKAGIRSLAYSPDGRWLVSAGYDEQANVWDLERKTLLHELPILFRDYASRMAVLIGPPAAFSADGTRLFVGCGDGLGQGAVRVWSVPDFQPLPTLPTSSPHVVFLASPDGGERLFAAASDGRVFVWDVKANKLLREFATPLGALTGFAVDLSGERVAAANPNGLIHLFNEFGDAQFTLQGFAAGVYSLAFDPQAQGNLLAAGYEDGRVKLWDLAKQRELAATTTPSLRCAALAYAPRQGWALAGSESGVIQRWESPACSETYRLAPQRYAFVVTRAREGLGIRLEARRNDILLRAEQQEAPAGPLSLTVRRKDESFTMQAGKSSELVFYDYFPPTPMEGGTWGVSLSPAAALASLTVNRRLPALTASPFEQGYSLFRRNRIPEALAFFEQQAKFAAGENAADIHQEAQLRSAVCLVRLNRLDDAKKILKLLAEDPGGGKQAALVALFQLWTIYLRQADHAEAGKVFAQVRLKEVGEELRKFIAADTQQQIVNYYLDFVSRRKSFIEPGMAPRMEAALAVCEFFDIDSERTLDLRWRYLETQRLLGAGNDPLSLGLLSTRFERGLRLPANPAAFSEKELARLAQYALLCRRLGRPARAETLLDSLLWDGARQLRPDVQGPSLALLLERARLFAHRQQWDEALRCLDQLFERGSQTVSPRRVLVASHLLRGFALRRRGFTKEAAEAWKNGCAKLNLSAADLNQAPLSEDGVTEFLGVLVLGALGEHFDDAALEQARAKLQTWAGSLSGSADLMPSLTPPPAGMRRMWRGAKGGEIAEELATGSLTNGEQAAAMFKLLAAEMVRDGGFGGQASPEQDEIIWRVCDGGMRAYFQDLVRMQGLLQIGLAWKAPDFVFGWPATIHVVPEAMQAELAYVLAHRCRLRGRMADARTLLQLARERSAEGSPVHRLVLVETDP